MPTERKVRSEESSVTARTDARLASAGGAARLARGHALLLLDRPLTVDAVARERQRLEPLLGDRLPAPLARAEGAVVQLLQGGDDVAQQAPVTIAELEEELAVVRGGRLVARS